MDHEVNATPDECLSRTEEYLLRRWPYGGHYSRNANQASMLVEEERGFLGKLLTAALFVVSLGARHGASNMHTATVTVVDKGDRAVVATAADKPEHQAELDRWAREELGGHAGMNAPLRHYRTLRSLGVGRSSAASAPWRARYGHVPDEEEWPEP